jgi:glycosyltransferase involved in cell wall biosynthesis
LYRWVERLCLGDAFDLLDAHFVWPDGVGVSLIARRLKLPYVVTLRGTINPRYGKACFGKRIREALRNAAAVISVSKPMAEIAIKLGVEPAAVRVIPNGVDAETFRPLDKAECRRRLGMDSSTPLVVCVAGLKRPKGQEDLIRAMQTIGGACLVLIGPPAGRPGYLTYLKALASRSGLDGRVLFAGRVDRATVVDYLNAADVSVLPSHGEGCPNVLLESLACGTPVVATSVGGVPDLLRAGCAGLLVPPREPAALASAIRQALATRWPRAAIRKAVAGRTWQIVADEVLEVFRLAVGR